MKKLTKIVALVAAMLFVCMTFCACAKEGCYKSGTMTLIVGTQTRTTFYKVDMTKVSVEGGLVAVLQYLHDTEGLTYVLTESTYGAYLSAVGFLEASDNEYICLYTTVESDFDVSDYKTTTSVSYESGEFSFTSSGVGASSMKIEDGCAIFITLAVMSY